MSVSIGAMLRSMISHGLNEGVGYHDLYHAVSQAGVSVTSSTFAREYRYAQGLTQGFVDFRGGGLQAFRDQIPDARNLVDAPVNWPDRYNARVQMFGRDLETGQFASKWINIGYDRLPTYGTIENTAAVLATLGTDRYQFEFHSVTGVTVEAAPLQPTA